MPMLRAYVRQNALSFSQEMDCIKVLLFRLFVVGGRMGEGSRVIVKVGKVEPRGFGQPSALDMTITLAFCRPENCDCIQILASIPV
jgi:hypothetical protein